MTKKILILAATLAPLAMTAIESGAQQPRKETGTQAAPAAPATPEERARKRAEAKQRQAEIEKKQQDAQQKADAEKQKSEAQEAQKRAAQERARDRKREEQERQEQCVIKPVMSDEEIAKCRAARRS